MSTISPVAKSCILATALACLIAPAGSAPDANWPGFRGPSASGVADGQQLPDTWDGATGTNLLWKVAVPGLAHSSPIVWGDRIFVTSAISSRADATFKPGLYGDGTASEDRTPQKWVVIALERPSGKTVWTRSRLRGRAEGEAPHQGDLRQRDARHRRPLRRRVLRVARAVRASTCAARRCGRRTSGVLNAGAYDLPEYEWGTASSPIIYKDLVIVQCDTQNESFVLACGHQDREDGVEDDAQGAAVVGDADRLPARAGRPPELVTNASNFIRGYDPDTGAELWRLGGSSKITAPTPIVRQRISIIVASGRAPERPIFASSPAAAATSRRQAGAASSCHVVWTKTGRGSYMPTPLIYGDIALRAQQRRAVRRLRPARPGEEIYRQRLEHSGSGFSASPGRCGRPHLPVQRRWRHLRRPQRPQLRTARQEPDGRAAHGDAGHCRAGRCSCAARNICLLSGVNTMLSAEC